MSSLLNFEYNGNIIQRREDGFINLTQMCKATGKRIDVWKKTQATNAYIEALQANYHQIEVVQTEEGVNGGTWGHPSLAINLARWISPEFAVWCDAHIFKLMETGKTSLNEQPDILRAPAPERDAIAYIEASDKLMVMKDGMLKTLLTDMLVDEIELRRNTKSLPSSSKTPKYTIVKVRARQLGYTMEQIGNGTALGRFVHSLVNPAFQEMVGRYPVYHYEINDELDSAIHHFFS